MSDLYCVFGNPIGHSKSPAIHAAFAAATGEDLIYEARLAPLDGFAKSVADFVLAGGKGANVTVPFKEEAFRLCTRLSERAARAGAVNTLSFSDGKVFGDNTDGAGLVRDITHNLGFSLAGKRILLLGAGGAARGVIAPLLGEKPAALRIVNRSAEKAQNLADAFADLSTPQGGFLRGAPQGGFLRGAPQGDFLRGAPQGDFLRGVPQEDFLRGVIDGGSFGETAGQSFDVLINATSASLSGAALPLPAGLFAAGSLAYDMMYGKGETPFLEQARQQGAAQLADGLGMLAEQAAEAFFVWRGVRPETAGLLVELRQALSA